MSDVVPPLEKLLKVREARKPSLQGVLERVGCVLEAWQSDANEMASYVRPVLIVSVPIFPSETPFMRRVVTILHEKGYRCRFDVVRHQLSIAAP